MRLAKFLICEYKNPRSHKMFYPEMIDWIKKYALNTAIRYYKEPKSRIYRARIGSDSFYIVHRSTEERRSRNTSNFYTLFMNHDPLWKEYPARDIICSSNKTTFIVIPPNDTKIGICIDRDMWYSKIEVNNKVYDIEAFNSILMDEVLTYFNIKYMGDIDVNMDKFKNFSKEMDKQIEKINPNKKHLPVLIEAAINEKKDFYTICQEALDPQKIGVTLGKIGDIIINSEVWCEAPVVLVAEEAAEAVLKEVIGK